MKAKPLDDLEMFELLQLTYPEKFSDESNQTWNSAMDFIEEMQGFESIADLLGRVVMLAPPMSSGFSGKLRHCLGKIEIADSKVTMAACVARDIMEPPK
jgi:hypothetical protein